MTLRLPYCLEPARLNIIVSRISSYALPFRFISAPPIAPMRTTFENPRRTSSADSVATDILLRAERPATVAAFLGEVLPMLLPALEEISPPSRCPAGALERWPKRGCDRTCQVKLSPRFWIAKRHTISAIGSAAPCRALRTECRSSRGASHCRGVHRDHGAKRHRELRRTLRRRRRRIANGPSAERLRQCAKQSETILSIVQQWSHTQEMETLLNQMAEASIQLLEADRASIFLWIARTTCWSVGPRSACQAASCACPTMPAS